MSSPGIHSAAPNLCSVCVDGGTRGNEFHGRLYHFYSAQPERFTSRDQLLLQIDTLCDAVGYPQAAEAPRSFAAAAARTTTQQKMEQCMSKEKLIEQKGTAATFVVHVMYRQNSTWQGTVTWAEQKQSANFRSALELVKLMDGAVEATGLPGDPDPGQPPELKPDGE